MKGSFFAYIWLKILGCAIALASVGVVLILAEPQRLSYFSLLLFKHQEMIKNVAIFGIFLGVYFLFYTTAKIPERYLKIKLLQGPIKMHPEMIKKTLEQWFIDQKINDVKLMNVVIIGGSRIGLELKTSNLQTAVYSLEDVESRLKEFMTVSLGINTPLDVQLFEI